MAALLLALALASADVASLERALAADPENLRIAADYRQLAIAAKDFDRPIGFLEKLTKRKDAGANSFLSLALAYVDKVPTSGDIRRLYLGRDAMSALTKSIERKPSPLAYYVRGQINLYYNNFIFKRIPRGLEDLKTALRLATAETPAIVIVRTYIAMGDGYWRLNDRAKAVETWKTAAERFPEDAELKRRLDHDPEKVRWAVTDALSPDTRVDTSLRGVVPAP
jgi:tetratricopeptide (TPR) repeat protein